MLRDEILRAREIGLNGLREHVKIEAPRKLYWADRLGVLIMADVPNWWGPPDSAAFREHDVALRGMIARDYNHPSVFAWVLFNETWGLETKVDGRDRYLPATERRVARDYRLAKSLDPTRLVEDNSVCCGSGHTESDLNSWHEYLPGWRWEAHDQRLSDSTFPGSTWNFRAPWRQAHQPMCNSEFGNVWGYAGSTGDVDWSWDYHRAIDAFRRHPKVCGWLYTEHHDVINEWNGYWRYDRSRKETGFGDLVPGMSLRDLHAPLYIALGDPELSRTVRPGEHVDVPLYASFLSSKAYGDSLTLRAELYGWNTLGERRSYRRCCPTSSSRCSFPISARARRPRRCGGQRKLGEGPEASPSRSDGLFPRTRPVAPRQRLFAGRRSVVARGARAGAKAPRHDDVQHGQDEQHEQRGGHQSANHHHSQRPLRFRADARRKRHRQQAEAGEKRRHEHRPQSRTVK